LVVPLQQEMNPEDIQHTDLIKGLVNEKAFHFSYNYNLTQSLQKNVNSIVVPDEESKGLQKKGSSEDYWSQYDQKLVFNRVLCSEFDSNTNERFWPFIVPLI